MECLGLPLTVIP